MSEVAGTVSAVVVNFNAGGLLVQCVEALRASDIEVEVIVVDNGSSDGSLDALRRVRADDPAVKTIENGRNLGFAAAVNRGLRAAHGSRLLLVNPDCVVEVHAVRRLIEHCDGDRDVGLAGGLVLNFDGSEQRGCRRREPTPTRAARRFLGSAGRWMSGSAGNDDEYDLAGTALPAGAVDVDAVSGSFLCLSRALFESVGGLDEGYFLHCEDLELCRAVRDRGLAVRFVPEAVAFHHGGASAGMSRARVEWHKHAGMLRYFCRHYRRSARPALRALVTVAVVVHWIVVAAVASTGLGRGRARAATAGDPLPAPDRERVIVLGATSQVGGYLLARLAAAAYDVVAITRGTRAGRHESGCRWFVPSYLETGAVVERGSVAAVISLAPIWVLPAYGDALDRLGSPRLVALSSTSVLTKMSSPEADERETARRLREGEAWTCARPGSTVLRPTMIYGGGNRNVDSIRRLVRRLRCFPLVDGGTGLRQPVHADDVAGACVAAMTAAATRGRIYTVAGGAPIRYREMVEDIFRSEGLKPRFVPVSGKILRFIVRLAAALPWFRSLTPAMVDRMSADMVFSNNEARKDFGYEARPFTP